jgi:CubicO group peptidase (beta-lactamase class C family)
MAKGFSVDHLIVMPYQHHRAGNLPLANGILHDGIDDGEAVLGRTLSVSIRPRRPSQKTGQKTCRDNARQKSSRELRVGFVSVNTVTLTTLALSAQETEVRGIACTIGPALASLLLCYKLPIQAKGISSERHPLNTGASTSVHVPPPAHEHQETIFAAAFEVLREAIAARAFPAASVAVTHRGKLVALQAYGRFTYEAESALVTPESIFDLASVSKIVATTSTAMVLYQRGLLDLETPVVAIVPEFMGREPHDNPPRRQVTLRMLLAHSSGLPAYEKLFQRTKSRDELLAAAFSTPLTASPGTRAEYSDIGFIVLGVALERLADESLDRFCQREIFGPLGMAHTAYNPPPSWRAFIPPTADDRAFRNRIIQGEVQDENASVLGGVAPQAGVFSSAQDVAIFANAMLHGGSPIASREALALFTRRAATPPGTSRALGWDTPSSPSQSGKYFSASSFGHLGYTGTSLWIDPERQLSVTLLTNRTWPDCTNQAIKEVRPRFHDAVAEAIEART